MDRDESFLHYRMEPPEAVTADAEEIGFVFSHSGVNYFFRRIPLGQDKYALIDSRTLYYVREAERFAGFVAEVVARYASVRRILFLGSSKGAFAALLHGALLAQRRPDLDVRIAAFSPQVCLWPRNDALTFATYTDMLKAAESDAGLAADLRAFGDASVQLSRASNARAGIVFGEKKKRDRDEAARLAHLPNVRLLPMPVGSHRTIIPYMIDCTSRQAIEDALLRSLDRDPSDPDTQDLRDSAALQREVAEFHALRGGPYLLSDLFS